MHVKVMLLMLDNILVSFCPHVFFKNELDQTCMVLSHTTWIWHNTRKKALESIDTKVRPGESHIGHC